MVRTNNLLLSTLALSTCCVAPTIGFVPEIPANRPSHVRLDLALDDAGSASSSVVRIPSEPLLITVVDDDEQFLLPPRLPDGKDNLLNMKRRRPTVRTGNTTNRMSNGGGTLHHMRARFIEEKEQVRTRNMRIYSGDPTILGQEINPYFDPFTREWRIWYTDTDLRTIFLPAS